MGTLTPEPLITYLLAAVLLVVLVVVGLVLAAAAAVLVHALPDDGKEAGESRPDGLFTGRLVAFLLVGLGDGGVGGVGLVVAVGNLVLVFVFVFAVVGGGR